ncbi:hypothetical protein EV360DRAFT_72494 [Lentinula raphanica]|nr:hypothetical protein EV360DRAFT_72494 [Lentinula raphanica]
MFIINVHAQTLAKESKSPPLSGLNRRSLPSSKSQVRRIKYQAQTNAIGRLVDLREYFSTFDPKIASGLPSKLSKRTLTTFGQLSGRRLYDPRREGVALTISLPSSLPCFVPAFLPVRVGSVNPCEPWVLLGTLYRLASPFEILTYGKVEQWPENSVESCAAAQDIYTHGEVVRSPKLLPLSLPSCIFVSASFFFAGKRVHSESRATLQKTLDKFSSLKLHRASSNILRIVCFVSTTDFRQDFLPASKQDTPCYDYCSLVPVQILYIVRFAFININNYFFNILLNMFFFSPNRHSPRAISFLSFSLSLFVVLGSISVVLTAAIPPGPSSGSNNVIGLAPRASPKKAKVSFSTKYDATDNYPVSLIKDDDKGRLQRIVLIQIAKDVMRLMPGLGSRVSSDSLEVVGSLSLFRTSTNCYVVPYEVSAIKNKKKFKLEGTTLSMWYEGKNPRAQFSGLINNERVNQNLDTSVAQELLLIVTSSYFVTITFPERSKTDSASYLELNEAFQGLLESYPGLLDQITNDIRSARTYLAGKDVKVEGFPHVFKRFDRYIIPYRITYPENDLKLEPKSIGGIVEVYPDANKGKDSAAPYKADLQAMRGYVNIPDNVAKFLFQTIKMGVEAESSDPKLAEVSKLMETILGNEWQPDAFLLNPGPYRKSRSMHLAEMRKLLGSARSGGSGSSQDADDVEPNPEEED